MPDCPYGDDSMKRLTVLLLMALLVCTGCASQRIPSTDGPAETGPADLNIVAGEYRAQYSHDYQFSVPLLMDDFSGWEVFLMNHPGDSSKEDALVQAYDESFFDHSVVYAYIESEPSGSISLKVKKVVLEGSVLKLYMERTIPQMGTDDIAVRICLFGISREDLKGVKSVDAVINEIRQ